MHLTHLEIDKICIHQIFKRNPDGSKKAPEKSSVLVKFDTVAMETFKQRVIGALGSQSKAVDMKIIEQDKDKTPSLFTSLRTVTDVTFIDTSYVLADKLADAQKRKGLSGGIVVVFLGSFGSTEADKRKKIVGVIKADIYSAYQKIEDENTHEISLKYVKEALLTPSSKLFKTAAFAEKHPKSGDSTTLDLNDSWVVAVSDYQISQVDGKIAAQYFYETFLGCGYPESSARNTQKFFESVKTFIKNLEVSNEEKYELNNALVCYLKLDKSGVISPDKFARTYFDSDTADDFIAHLGDSGVPITSFTKDTQHVNSKLKMQKVSFGQNIRLLAPAEILKDKVIMEPIVFDENGIPVNWTKLVIKEKLALPQ
ncbi:nucleoid-associated protein [Providencia huaxiensis]|uniref:nucleoid-associated protein n=1 Tax=Providencia TaxID=586 RepID=UPI001B386245|nr:nucleoid-associated protein [Providencia rettgeri]EJD6370312.1 nucleoid-associated protein [Providencia rettgeri]EJD6374824.1 nucleoid-associated protein [Providencia rettgeri]ELR5033164.1 nucleoid-associated protein [Providencia rettgeri]ELR5159928.1 nucleoid-associated protein [Providencia rettgeri]ELR5208996.1 nucleoid-associated protein [Providencia rettgeri]